MVAQHEEDAYKDSPIDDLYIKDRNTEPNAKLKMLQLSSSCSRMQNVTETAFQLPGSWLCPFCRTMAQLLVPWVWGITFINLSYCWGVAATRQGEDCQMPFLRRFGGQRRSLGGDESCLGKS